MDGRRHESSPADERERPPRAGGDERPPRAGEDERPPRTGEDERPPRPGHVERPPAAGEREPPPAASGDRTAAPPPCARAGSARPLLWALAAVLLAGVALGGAHAFRAPERLGRTPVVEDAYYALAAARQLGLGNGLTIDGTTPTNGLQPGWALVTAPLYALAGGDRWTGLRLTVLLSTALWLAFAGLLAAAVRRRARGLGLDGNVAAAAVLLLVIGSASVFRVFHNGLETGLQLLALLGAVIALDRARAWTPRTTLVAAAALAAACWARLDAVLLLAAVGAVALWRARGGRRLPWGPLAACALAALSLTPWLGRNLAIEGHLMPTSGQAESLVIDVSHNAEASLRAYASWALPVLYRAPLHRHPDPVADAGALAAIAVLALAVHLVRRRAPVRPPPRLGLGTASLPLYVGGLVAFYTVAFGSWWSLDRYLAPALLVSVPWLACAAELVATGRLRLARPARRAAVAAALGAIALVNLPVMAVSLTAPPRLPSWSSPETNLGSHENDNFFRQTRWTLANVAPECVVGARQTGTLGYFRPRVVNLDGKVNGDALRARATGRLRAYLDAARVDVVVDARGLARHVLGPGRRGFVLAGETAGYEAWVRRGRGACLLRRATAFRG